MVYSYKGSWLQETVKRCRCSQVTCIDPLDLVLTLLCVHAQNMKPASPCYIRFIYLPYHVDIFLSSKLTPIVLFLPLLSSFFFYSSLNSSCCISRQYICTSGYFQKYFDVQYNIHIYRELLWIEACHNKFYESFP